MTAPDSSRPFFRRLAVDVYIPWAVVQLGRGMLLPIVPLYLRDEGMSYTLVSVVLASMGVGAVLGGLPAGSIAGRFGSRTLFTGGVALMGVAAALLGTSTAVMALVAFRIAYGMGAVGLRISAQMLVRSSVPPHLLGRGMSLLGGSVRVMFFIGPLIGGLLADTFGYSAAFAACGVVTLMGLIPVLTVKVPEGGPSKFARPPGRFEGLSASLRTHRTLLLLAGIAPALVTTVRAGRNVVVPLIGDDLGLTATQVGALVAVGTGADVLLFPIAGWLMDRFGRLWSIVPAFTLLGLGLFVLGLSTTAAGAIVAGVIMGVGNGMSAGTMLTLGADIAPREPGPFLAALGTMQDLGFIIGPLLVGWLADAAGLGASAVVLAIVMFAAVAWIVIVLGDTAHPSRRWLVDRLEA